MPNLRNCIVLLGPEMVPHHCIRFAWERDTITAIDLGAPVEHLEAGALVVMPALTNGHTHIGDSVLPEGAVGLTAEEAYGAADSLQARVFGQVEPAEHFQHVAGQLQYLARTGTIRHLDFREEGPEGARLLRAASHETGLESIILGQFASRLFSAADLAANTAALSEPARAELIALLPLADGFSADTINDLTDVAWREVRGLTSERHRLRAIHCRETVAGQQSSLDRTGKGELARALELLDPHLVVQPAAADAGEITLLAQSKKTVAVCPRASASLGRPLPPVAALLAAGVNLLIGTDHVMLSSANLFAELDFTYRLARSQSGDAVTPSPTDILRMATSNIRPLLGDDHFGWLEKGLPADFVVLDFFRPHLRASRHIVASVVTRVTPEDVVATFRHGRPLWQVPDFQP